MDIVEGKNPVKVSFGLISPAGLQPNIAKWEVKRWQVYCHVDIYMSG